MNSKWAWWISQVARRIWFRATLFSVLAIATALLAIVVSPYIPADLPAKIGADAVDKILGIIASSMLTVTTFSLSTMVSAYAAATSSVTPRATRLVMEDSTTQNVLATFVGSFLFSLVGIIALTTGAYGDQGRLVLFLVTLAVIAVIVVALLRWIDHLSRLGRVTETTDRVEEATESAMRIWKRNPHLGGHPLRDLQKQIWKTRVPVFATTIGYVQHVDASALSDIAGEMEAQIAVMAIPGKLVTPADPVAFVTKAADEETMAGIADCFTIDDIRSFDQDPRFGACVLTEIASRALSPALNDPGTAIDVITRATRLLAMWAAPTEGEAPEIAYPRLYVLPIDPSDLFDDFFRPIARDGAGLVEVGLRLQKALDALSRLQDGIYREHALRHSREALARAEVALHIDADKERLRNTSIAKGASKRSQSP